VCGQGKVAQAGGSTCRHQDFPSVPGNVRRETGDFGKQPEIHLPQGLSAKVPAQTGKNICHSARNKCNQIKAHKIRTKHARIKQRKASRKNNTKNNKIHSIRRLINYNKITQKKYTHI